MTTLASPPDRRYDVGTAAKAGHFASSSALRRLSRRAWSLSLSLLQIVTPALTTSLSVPAIASPIEPLTGSDGGASAFALSQKALPRLAAGGEPRLDVASGGASVFSISATCSPAITALNSARAGLVLELGRGQRTSPDTSA